MTRLKKFEGNVMTHKHRGTRWTVRVAGNIDDELFNWLCDNWGDEDFENGPWARIYESWNGQDYGTYDVTDAKIVAMISLRWG